MTQSNPPVRPRRPPVRPAFDPQAQPWTVADDGLAAIAPGRLTPAALRQAFGGPLPATAEQRGDDARYPGREGPPVPAAVLIPLVARAEGPCVLLTQRTAHLYDHAGQISFPGGRVEPTDADAVAAALRETEEETGLQSSHIEVLGSMAPYRTATGFVVTPVAALVQPGFTLAPDSFEVAEVFEVPLAFLMDPANHRRHRATLADGTVRNYYSMPWKGYFIWGATAAMLRNLYRLLAAEPARPAAA